MRDIETSKSATSDLTRRGFLITSIASGFALSVQPIAGQTKITTDANGLTAGEVKIPVKGGEMPSYRAMPEKGKDFPLVLVVQEIFGVHEHNKTFAVALQNSVIWQSRRRFMRVTATLQK